MLGGAQAKQAEPANAAAHATRADLENRGIYEDDKQQQQQQGGSSSRRALHSDDSLTTRIWRHLGEEVNTEYCTIPLIGYCFMTGWVDAISFAAAFIFSGFQTGNVVQLAAALARLFSGPDKSSYFHYADRLALTSLCSFILGSSIGQLGDRIGPKKRLWVIGATLLQSGFMMVSFICLLIAKPPAIATDRGDVAWSSGLEFLALAFASASMGLQGICGKRLNTHYGTTVVLTTIWCEFISDPGLFHLNRKIPSRDHRLTAILMLFVGAFVGRILVDAIGSAATFGIGAALKAAIGLSFWFVPSKKVVAKK